MQYKRCVGCAMAPPHSRPRAKSRGKAKALADRWWRWTHGRHKVWRRGQSGHKAGHKAETWQTRPSRTQGGYRAEAQPKRTQGGHKADTRQTGGRMADKVWRRGQSELKVDTRRKHGGHMVDKAWRRGQSGLKVDTRRTSSGDRARAYRGQPFFLLRKNPTVNCLGKNYLRRLRPSPLF